MTLQTIGDIGAGQMGRGIAQVCAISGLRVILNDVSEATLERSIGEISSRIARMASKHVITNEQAEEALSRIRPSMALKELRDSNVAIECATENSQIKSAIIGQLNELVGPNPIIATNTSSLSITRLGSLLSDPRRFIGLHFFNPVPSMELVEVIRGIQTSDETFNVAMALVRRLGKIAIDVRNSPGFAVNRILVPMINEAILVLQERLASAAEIDQGMKLGANHPLGPLALADLIGLDTVLAIMEGLYPDFNDPKYRPAILLKEMVDARMLGRKTGKGFFDY